MIYAPHTVSRYTTQQSQLDFNTSATLGDGIYEGLE